MIARRMTSRIFMSRLPVGHTHEDIDARFGKLSQKIRHTMLLSPQKYAEAMETTFGSNAKTAYRAVNVFHTPDFKALFEHNIDPAFGTYAKTEQTQLCWKYEAVPRSANFPLGCRTMYRAYASDMVYELVPQDDPVIPDVPWSVKKTYVEWEPRVHGREEMSTANFDGMHILQQFPAGPIMPAAFIPGHLSKFDACYNTLMTKPKFCNNNAAGSQALKKEWDEFATLHYPQTESVEEYLTNHNFKVPLRDTLFSYLRLAEFQFGHGAQDYGAANRRATVLPTEIGDANRFGAVVTNPALDYDVALNALRAAEDRLNVQAQLTLPSVTWQHNRSNVVDPRLPVTQEQRQALAEYRLRANDVRVSILSQPLYFPEAYDELIADKLHERIRLRCLVPVSSRENGRFLKEDLVAW